MKKYSEQEIREKLKDLEGWDYDPEQEGIFTAFKFGNFKEAFSVMTQIAFEAEAMQHHPNWCNVYNELQILLQTHDANGVTDKDFKLAATINGLVLA